MYRFGKNCVESLTKNPGLIGRVSNLLQPHHNYSFKSAYALENLYPKSETKLTTPTFTTQISSDKFSGFIPIDKLTITYSHSSGPGGQNVNTSDTKVDLRFQVASAEWLSEGIRQNLATQEKTKINKEGYLIIKSDVTRHQHLNLAHALEKLRSMIRSAVPRENIVTPESEEYKLKLERKAARERIFQKRMRSQIKQARNMSNFE